MGPHTITTRGGHLLELDDAGLNLYQAHVWCVQTRRSRSGRVYRYLGRKGDRQLFHRVLLDAPAGFVVDHQDGNGLNNVSENLRICTHAENMRNRRATAGRELPKGVSADGGRFKAEVRASGARYYKNFKHLADAIAWREAMAKQLHGAYYRKA